MHRLGARRGFRVLALCGVLFLAALPSAAQDREITLAAPAAMSESGFLKHVLPRFSLKHSIRVSVVAPEAAADLAFSSETDEGRPAFDGDGVTYRLVVTGSGNADHAETFAEWLASAAGLAAVTGFTVDGAAPYGPPTQKQVAAVEIAYDGNAEAGETLSLGLCGRCHVVGEMNRMNGIGSTPSFSVLRTMSDWEYRFTAFYVLKPHAAFTQVADVTSPFPPESPSPIAPIEMTLDQLENIVAYVAQMPPADLGAPIEHQ